MTKAKKKSGPPEEHWHFARCPHPEQTRACYLYEYSLASNVVRAEVEAVRKKRDLAESPPVKQKIAEWWRANPRPPGNPFASARTQELQEWFRKFREAIPEADGSTKLNSDLHFLLSLDYFPGRHWLEIPAIERQRVGHGLYPDRHRSGSLHDPAQLACRLEADPMMIESLEDFLFRPFPPLTWHGYYVFLINWERSNTKLREDFGQWLEEHRPKDQPGFHLTKQSTSRATTERDLLKNLTAFQLIRHFDNSARRARDYYLRQTGASLYNDDAAWKKAEAKARQEIKRFDRLAE
jgi:hypothetical protein